MPIDRIGKGGGIPTGAPGATGPDAAAAPTKAFEVNPSASTQKVDRTQAAGTGPLAELKAGKIDVHQYVEQKLDEATKHLGGLHPTELEHIRGVLRDKIAHDPQIADLVRQAAGSVPSPPDE